MAGRPGKYKTTEELQNSIDDYFNNQCGNFLEKDENGKVVTDRNGNAIFRLIPPTVCGLAYHLGYASRQSIYDLEKKSDDFSYTIKRALLKCEQFAEEQLYGSRPVGAIFALKNRGWKDKSEQDLNVKLNILNQLENLTDEQLKELEQKYKTNNTKDTD
jgi:hypothetical protein